MGAITPQHARHAAILGNYRDSFFAFFIVGVCIRLKKKKLCSNLEGKDYAIVCFGFKWFVNEHK